MPGEMARSDPRPSARVTRGAGSGRHLASVLQEGRENANIDAALGFIWGISANRDRGSTRNTNGPARVVQTRRAVRGAGAKRTPVHQSPKRGATGADYIPAASHHDAYVTKTLQTHPDASVTRFCHFRPGRADFRIRGCTVRNLNRLQRPLVLWLKARATSVSPRQRRL
jgi:hypothetical protein